MLPRELAKIMGISLIWATTQEELAEAPLMPNFLRERLSERVQDVFEINCNPVKQIPIHVSGEGDQVQLIEIQGNRTPISNNSTDNGSAIAALTSIVLEMKSRMEQIYNAQQGETYQFRTEIFQHITKLQHSVARIANQPVVRTVPNQESTMNQNLLSKPKNLFELWNEHELGINGKKPAWAFTSVERGRCKFPYSSRKIFWDVVDLMIRRGSTSDTAIDRIYSIYGHNNSNTKIFLAMRSDR